MTDALPSINEVIVLNNAGPWKTKSNAELNVLFGLDINFLLNKFFKYNYSLIKIIGSDIRGLRSYIVSNIPKRAVGANEWHIIRNELAIVSRGKIEWTLTDHNGLNKIITLDEHKGIFIPNHILHTYKALTQNSEIIVIANTLFDPSDSKTHDSYSIDLFEKQFLTS